jgi:hypothetical protein
MARFIPGLKDAPRAGDEVEGAFAELDDYVAQSGGVILP